MTKIAITKIATSPKMILPNMHNSSVAAINQLTGDDFVLVGMNYNYFMIPKLAYPKDNLEKLKQQVLDNQEMVAELKAIWDKGKQDTTADEILQIMEKHFGL